MIRGGLLSLTMLAWLGSGWTTASAQVVVAPGPAPVVAYYAPPVAVAPAYYYAPAPVGVSYYYAAPVPVAAPAPVVIPTVAAVPASYYVPAYPARVSRGLFGRTIVRTPFSKTKF